MEHQQQRGREGSRGQAADAVRVRLLGGFSVSVNGRTIERTRWRKRKAAHLLKLLALAEGHSVHRERATELLWPHLGAKAASNNFHRTLHYARGALLDPAPADAPDRRLTLRNGLVELCRDAPLWVDVEAFEEAAANARRSGRPTAYRAAIELYAGELLPEDRYEEWTEERRGGLRRLHRALLVELAAVHERRGELAPAVEALHQALAADATDEESSVALMRVYALAGRRPEALLQYERLRTVLRDRLGVEPGDDARHLYGEIRAGGSPASPQSPAARPKREPLPPNNLPASLTSFVGREAELPRVKRDLWMTRLLTLTGAGGSGKTRLALEAARDLAGAYPDGVWLVELAPLSDPELVLQTVAQALDVREQPGRSLAITLADYLRARELLLILDNCEHLVDAAAHLAKALLNACPRLRILATSREPLGVPGETVWPVPTLSLTGVDGLSAVGSSMRAEAVRLFVERARSRLPGFELNAGNAGAVARVCRKLDGIPLAIELACARMGALAIEQVAQRLEGTLDLLTAGARTAEPRQQTLRATLDWSHELLDEAEKVLFARLSVFAGGWTLEAAERVCEGDGIEREGVLDLLSGLVDKSMVAAEASPQAGRVLRYRMLEPVRQYGRERLEAAAGTAAGPEVERVRQRHAEYFLALAEETDVQEPGLALKPSLPRWWFERIEVEHGNLRAALAWALYREEAGELQEELGFRLAVATWWFWYARDYQTEGRRYLERALSSRSSPAMAPFRARALIGAGWMAVTRADFGAAQDLMEEGLTLCRELGDKEGIASALTELGWVTVLGQQRDGTPIAAVLEDLMLLKPQLENRSTLAHLLLFEGAIVGTRGDLERAVTLHEESLELFREMRDEEGTVFCLSHLGLIALLKADYEGAASLSWESLRLARELRHKQYIQICLYMLACMAAAQHQPSRAARLWGAVEGIRETYGLHITPITLSLTNYEDRLATARSQLGEGAFAAAWEEGETMELERAIDYAFSKEEWYPPTPVPAPEQPPADAPAETLTPREREVALLVSRELTNRQIAAALSISEHTVANHVRKILKKLGLRSRVQIGA